MSGALGTICRWTGAANNVAAQSDAPEKAFKILKELNLIEHESSSAPFPLSLLVTQITSEIFRSGTPANLRSYYTKFKVDEESACKLNLAIAISIVATVAQKTWKPHRTHAHNAPLEIAHRFLQHTSSKTTEYITTQLTELLTPPQELMFHSTAMFGGAGIGKVKDGILPVASEGVKSLIVAHALKLLKVATADEWFKPTLSIERFFPTDPREEVPQKTHRQFVKAVVERVASQIMEQFTDYLLNKSSSLSDGVGPTGAKKFADTFISLFKEQINNPTLKEGLVKWLDSTLHQAAQNYSGQLANKIFEIYRPLTPLRQLEIESLAFRKALRQKIREQLISPKENLQERLSEAIITHLGGYHSVSASFARELDHLLATASSDQECLWHFLEQHLQVFAYSSLPVLKEILSQMEKAFKQKDEDEPFQTEFRQFLLLRETAASTAASLRKQRETLLKDGAFKDLALRILGVTGEADAKEETAESKEEAATPQKELQKQVKKIYALKLGDLFETQIADLTFTLYDHTQTISGMAKKGDLDALAPLFHDFTLIAQRVANDRGISQVLLPSPDDAERKGEKDEKRTVESGAMEKGRRLQRRSHVFTPDPNLLSQLKKQIQDEKSLIESSVMEKGRELQRGLHAFTPYLLRQFKKQIQTDWGMQQLTRGIGLELEQPVIQMIAKAAPEWLEVGIIKKYIQDMTNTILPKIVLSLTKDREIELVLGKTLLRVFEAFNSPLKANTERLTLEYRMQAADRQANPLLKADERRKIFLPVANAIFEMIGPDLKSSAHPLSPLPLSEELKKTLWESMQSSLADWLADTYTEMAKHLSPRIEAHPLPTHIQESAKVISAHATELLKHSLTHQTPMMSTLFNNILEGIENSTSARELGAFVKEHHALLQTWLSANGALVAQTDNEATKKFFNIFQKALGTFAEKALMGMHQTVEDVNTPQLTMHITSRVMTAAKHHVRAFNESANGLKPSKIPLEKMRKALHGLKVLHPSMAPTKSEEERLKLEMNTFYKPLAEDLFVILNIQEADIPLPKEIKGAALQLLKETLPLMLKTLYEEISPRNGAGRVRGEVFNPLKLHLVKNLKDFCNSFDKPANLGEQESNRAAEHKMSHECPIDPDTLAETGAILKEVIDWLPNFFVAALFKNVEAVKDRGAYTFGKSIYHTVMKKNLTGLLKDMIQHGVTTLHPGKWDDQGNFTSYIFDPATGKAIEGRGLQFKWPTTKQEEEKAAAERTAKAKAIESELIREAHTLSNDGVSAVISHTLDRYWSHVEDCINHILHKIFHDAAGPIQFIVKIIFKIIFRVFWLATSPIYLLGVFINRQYNAYKVRQFHENLNHPIHESLVRTIIQTSISEIRKAIEEKRKKELEGKSEAESKEQEGQVRTPS